MLAWCLVAALLAVDPGLQGTGLAFWSSTRTPAPEWTEVVSDRKGDWLDRSDRIARHVAERLRTETTTGRMLGDVRLVCELMEMHGGARAQMMWKSGDLQRTLIFTGMLIARTSRYVDKVTLVGPGTWKGQLPKSVVEHRLKRYLGGPIWRTLGIRSHAWDAVGIGLWALGKF